MTTKDTEDTYEAGVAACLSIAIGIHKTTSDVAHPDAEYWMAECVERIKNLAMRQKDQGIETARTTYNMAS